MLTINNMKKIFLGLTALGMLAVAGSAQASSIVLSPATISVTKGQTFNIIVTVEPQGSKLYTVKAVVNYPVALVEPTAFAYNPVTPAWVPLSQPGYDSMGSGAITKTAGYPGGFTASQAFGTITFRALADGSATLSIAPSSVAYDAQSKNTLSGTHGSSQITIAPPPSQPSPAPQPPPGAGAKPPAPSVAQEEGTTEVAEATSTATVTPSIAAVAGSGLGGIAWWVWALGILALAGLGGGVWYLRRSTARF